MHPTKLKAPTSQEQEQGLQKYQKTKTKSSLSDLVIRKKIPNNPYISSITGEFLLNLSKYKNFSIYYSCSILPSGYR